MKPYLLPSDARRWCVALLLAVLPLFGTANAALYIEDIHAQPLADFDAREAQAAVAANATQRAIVDGMSATVRWNRFGTPQTLIKHGDFLATGLDADPVVAARDFLVANAGLFRVAADDVAAWELYHVGDFAFSDATAVKFRQTFDGQPSQSGGLVTVGVVNGNVAIVTSSIAGVPASTNLPAATISAADAIAIAASDAGFNVTTADLSAPAIDNEWTNFTAAGMVGTQRVRPMAFPTSSGVHNVYEAWTISNDGGSTTAYMHLVDASNGAIVYRQNKVFQHADDLAGARSVQRPAAKPDNTRAPSVNAFDGIYTGATCGPSGTTYHGPYTSNGTEGYVEAVVAASAVNPVDDIVIDVYIDRGDGEGIVFLAQFDFLFSPEQGTISPVEAADYYVQICAFDGQDPIAPPTPPVPNYTGTFTFNDSSVTGPDPRWLHFPANPLPDLSSTDIRELGCWLDDTCDFTVANSAARAPWDYDHNSGAPSFTTIGNAAISGEAWLSPLTPAEQYRPTDAFRNYSFPWTNVWHTSGCSVANFVPGVGNDIDAAVTNMFVAHNRMHDWAYHLGWTEVNSNHQTRNFGNTDTSREGDPILGNVQAGAVDGAFPAYLGRDNANWVPLPDGAPGITNQYLWQALLGAIYVPCADGNYDMGIVGHEVGHGIQHRMTGGPATG
ncbi:MAG: M36 family metallopeptidase, partial [Gammaproteobacteria bacterium]|nr:M36 family metallopeptidase [Gammaproteobacteria bacterium]